jgi:hypothetical protein
MKLEWSLQYIYLGNMITNPFRMKMWNSNFWSCGNTVMFRKISRIILFTTHTSWKCVIFLPGKPRFRYLALKLWNLNTMLTSRADWNLIQIILNTKTVVFNGLESLSSTSDTNIDTNNRSCACAVLAGITRTSVLEVTTTEVGPVLEVVGIVR